VFYIRVKMIMIIFEPIENNISKYILFII